MTAESIKPCDIEKRSFEIIKSELQRDFDDLTLQIVLRVIHTTADFDYANNLAFSEGAIERAVTAIRNGTEIVTDTNMVMAGIDKRRLLAFGCGVHCFTHDDDVAKTAASLGCTRSRVAMEKAAMQKTPMIFAIGNAPTALSRICELKKTGELSPEFVIGVPVGFVNVIESKETLELSGIHYITARGRKGGSNVAAAIMNALLRLASA